jgi:hypothetical protein
LQDRLPKELALAGIATRDAANRFIAERYLPEHNAAFAIAPTEASGVFVPDGTGAAGTILCIQEERRVGNDNTVKWRGLALQIPASPLRPHFARASVRVHEYPDGPTRGLPRPTSAGRLRSRGNAVRQRQIGCLSRFGSRPDGFVDNAVRSPPPHRPTTTEAVN